MLTHAGCRERQARLWQRLPDEILWVLIGDDRHVQYFSNFRINPITFSADQKTLLLMTREEMRNLPHVRAFNDFIASRTSALRHMIEGRVQNR